MIPNIVIIHCSDTPDYSVGDIGYDRFRAKDIDAWHKARGWKMIGYHYVITRAGKVENGRPLDMIGAHCEGYNSHSLGICYIGTKTILPSQIKCLQGLFLQIYRGYSIPAARWFCHNDFNKSKACPGFTHDELQKLLAF